MVVQYYSMLVQYYSMLVQYYSMLVQYYSMLVQYYSMLVQYYSMLVQWYIIKQYITSKGSKWYNTLSAQPLLLLLITLQCLYTYVCHAFLFIPCMYILTVRCGHTSFQSRERVGSTPLSSTDSAQMPPAVQGCAALGLSGSGECPSNQKQSAPPTWGCGHD